MILKYFATRCNLFLRATRYSVFRIISQNFFGYTKKRNSTQIYQIFVSTRIWSNRVEFRVVRGIPKLLVHG